MKVRATISKLLRFAVCMTGVALTAHAQNSYLVSSNPNEVIQTGVTELLGEIRLTKGTSGNTPQTTISSTIAILYRNVLVQNAFTGSRNIDLSSGTISDSRGITIRFSSDWLNDSISSRLSATVFGTGSGSLLTIEIPGGISLDADGESIAVTGVRATPTGLAVGADVTASISSSPSIAHSFLNGSTVSVARVRSALSVAVSGVSAPVCASSTTPLPRITIEEGFPAAFRDRPSFSGSTADPVGDASAPSPDLISAAATASGGNLKLSVRFSEGTFNPQTTTATFGLDMDQNPATGHPGVASSGTIDGQILGSDFIVDMGSAFNRGQARISRYTGPPINTFTLTASVPITTLANGIDVSIPLRDLADDEGGLNFKVTSASQVSENGFTGILDIMPDEGLLPGTTSAGAYGATSSTQIRIVTSNLPSGVSLSWPQTARSGIATLNRVSQTSNGAEALYEFTTTNQASSDLNLESFQMTPEVTISAGANLGQSVIQAQLYPTATGTDVPRFNDPLQPDPGAAFLNVTTCGVDPSITSIVPSSGLVIGGTSVVITGTGFEIGATVGIASVTALVSSVTPTQINATTGAAALAGIYDVVVINPGGGSATLQNGFTYSELPLNHTVSSVPLNAVQTGVAELMGQVKLTKSAPNRAAQVTSASVISFLYQGLTVANTFSGSRVMNVGTGVIEASNGITISVTGGWRNAGVNASVVNIADGGRIDLSVPAGLVINDGDTIAILGVRATLTGRPLGSDVNVSVSSTPSTAHTFGNVSQIQVARANAGLSVTVSGVNVPACAGPASIVPTVTIAEGFSEGFAQHTPAPAGARTPYGAGSNTQVRIVITNFPRGANLSWPVNVKSGSISTLNRVSQNANGAEVLYEFSTTNQTVSDQNRESFQISPSVTISPEAVIGQSRIQAQLYPAATGTNLPRFDDRLQPVTGENFISLIACTESIPPSVTLTVPADGSTVSGVIEVAAEATDNVGIVGVQFLVDGTVIGSEDREVPYSILYDTSLLSVGRHEFSARARDAAENRATAAAVTVTKIAVPKIGELNPSSAFEGDPSFSLSIFGNDFTPRAIAMWNKSPRVTEFVSSSHIVAKILTHDIVNPGTYSVSVKDGNVSSMPLLFVVKANDQPPVLTGVLPPFISVQGSTRIRLLGRNFKPRMAGSTQFLVGGKPVMGLTFVNSSEMDAIAPPNPEGLSDVVMILPAGLGTFDSDRLVWSLTSGVGLEYRPNPEVPSTKPGYKRQRIPFVIDTSQFRTNLGINNVGDTEATVEILMSDSNGRLVFSRKSVKVPARGMTQCNRVIQLAEKAENENSKVLDCGFVDPIPLTGREGYLLLESQQPFVAWASQIDNLTLDPSVEQGFAESAAATRLVLPSSASINQFRTSLVVVNHSDTAGQVQIRSPRAQNGTPQPAINKRLEPYGYLFYEDFYREIGESGTFGPIELETTGGISITAAARIYTHQGTSGYFEAVDLARASRQVLLPYSLDNLDFRTNLGITNPGERDAHVTIKLANRDGHVQGSLSDTIAPHSMTQINGINRQLNGASANSLEGYLLLESDEPVIGWTSQIDNQTEDTSMVVGKPRTASTSSRLLIPSTTRVGSFRSTLAIVNLADTPTQVRISARNSAGTVVADTLDTSSQLMIEPSGFISYSDILESLNVTGTFGPLEVVSLNNSALLVVSQVFSIHRTGGYFEGIPLGP